MSTSFFRPTASARSRAIHRDHPYMLDVDGTEHRVDYEPRNRPPGFSAATPTGAGRSGSR